MIPALRHLMGSQELWYLHTQTPKDFLQLIIDAKELVQSSFSPDVDHERIHFEQDNNHLASIRKLCQQQDQRSISNGVCSCRVSVINSIQQKIQVPKIEVLTYISCM